MRARPSTRWLLAALLVMPWIAGPCPDAAWGKDSRVEQVRVVRADGAVSVSARLEGAFPKEVVKQIRRGVPKDLFYTVTLNRRHRRWFDEELDALTVQYTVKYDTLQGRYHVRRIGPDGEETEREEATFDAAVEAVSRLDGVTLPLPPGQPPGDFYASVKAEMRAVRLPLYLDYVFFFIPIQEFETPWARSGTLDRAQ